MKIKGTRLIGLVLLAALAGTVLAASAQAAEFEADSYPVTFTGEATEGLHEFETAVGTFECNAIYHGEGYEAETEMPLTTGYNGCMLNELVAATMTFLSCHTRFTASEEGGETTAVGTDFVCQPGGSIVIEVPGVPCRITIEPNQSLGLGLAHNETLGGKGDIRVEVFSPEVKYEIEGTSCLGKNGSYENGVYRGNVTLEGEKPFLASPKIGIRVT